MKLTYSTNLSVECPDSSIASAGVDYATTAALAFDIEDAVNRACNSTNPYVGTCSSAP